MQYSQAYLREYYDSFEFLDPECHDIRNREIKQRTKYCNHCLGLKDCQMYPGFWLSGSERRLLRNEELRTQFPDEPEVDIEEAAAPEEAADLG